MENWDIMYSSWDTSDSVKQVGLVGAVREKGGVRVRYVASWIDAEFHTHYEGLMFLQQVQYSSQILTWKH